jgi:hypothetical protein
MDLLFSGELASLLQDKKTPEIELIIFFIIFNRILSSSKSLPHQSFTPKWKLACSINFSRRHTYNMDILLQLLSAFKFGAKLSPFDVFLRPAKDITWIPQPLGTNDIALMEIVTSKYDKKGSLMINRCRLYLRIISLYELLLFDCPKIHESYREGTRPPSTDPTFLWPEIPYPPKKYWQLWSHFLKFHIIPWISKLGISWHTLPPI